MTRSQDSVVITLKIETVQFTKDVPGEIHLTWTRHGKGGNTPSKKLDNTHQITFDSVFPMNCNFKRKKNKWVDKILTVELFYGAKKIYKWSVNLANLFSSDIVNTDLKCENAALGLVTASIVLFLGPPEKMAQIPRQVGARKTQGNHQRYASVVLNEFHLDDQQLPSTDLCGLLDSTAGGNNGLNISTFGRSSHRRVASTFIPANVTAQLFEEEKDGMKDRIDILSKGMRENGPKYTDGVPFFGIKIIDLFSEQPRGTSFVDALSATCTSVCTYAQLNLQSCLYGFMSLACIYAGLKNYGWDSMTRNYDVKDKVDQLFNSLIDKLATDFSNDLMTDDLSANDKVKEVFQKIEGDEFATFLVDLILFTLFSSLPPVIAKKRIVAAGIDNAPFFDKSLLDTHDDCAKLVQNDKALEAAHEYIEDVPYPSLC